MKKREKNLHKDIPKKKVTLSIDSDIYNRFQNYCEEQAIMLSKRIELFMRKVMEEKEK